MPIWKHSFLSSPHRCCRNCCAWLFPFSSVSNFLEAGLQFSSRVSRLGEVQSKLQSCSDKNSSARNGRQLKGLLLTNPFVDLLLPFCHQEATTGNCKADEILISKNFKKGDRRRRRRRSNLHR